MTSSGTDLLAAWSESFGIAYSNVARVVPDFDALAAAHDPATVLSFVGEAQTDVEIARGPNGVFAVWNDPGRYEVWAAINGVPRLIDQAVSFDWVGWPSVAAGEHGFLVVWRHDVQNDRDRVFARRFDFDGQPIDPQPILLDATENFGQPIHTPPSIAFDGSAFLVAWTRTASSSLNTVRMREEGEPFDVRTIPMANTSPLSVRTLWTGAEFLVAYTFDTFSGPIGFSDPRHMALARIDHSSNVLSQSPATTFTDNGIASVGVAATVVPGRVTYAWVDGSYSIAVAQATFDGQILRAPRVIVQRTRADGASSADIVWDGSEYVLMWHESIGNTTGRKLRAVRLDTDLRPIDPEPFDIFSEPGPLSNPSLITTPAGVTIAYSRYDSANNDTARVFMRTLARLTPQIPHRRTVGH